MKTLYLLRHAKSSWAESGLQDWQRPLLPRGMKRALLVARKTKKIIRPDLIVSSYALRAANTAILFARTWHYPLNCIVLSNKTYEASYHHLIRYLAGLDNRIRSVMLVGHNPGLGELGFRLTGERREMTTSALLGIRLSIPKWAEIEEGVGKIYFFESGKFPRH